VRAVPHQLLDLWQGQRRVMAGDTRAVMGTNFLFLVKLYWPRFSQNVLISDICFTML